MNRLRRERGAGVEVEAIDPAVDDLAPSPSVWRVWKVVRTTGERRLYRAKTWWVGRRDEGVITARFKVRAPDRSGWALADAGLVLVTSVADTFAAAAQAASRGMPTRGVRRTAMSIFRTEALISYRLDEAEDARRRAAAAARVPSADVLELLLGLPTGMPVSVSSLTGRERDALASAPVGLVVVEHGQVTRHAIPPVSVDLALVGTRTWQRGLEVAGRFTPFCARAMVLPDYPTDLEQLRVQADFYGIGVIVSTDDVTEVLVEPAPFRRVRFTASGWQFLERVYRHR